MDQWSIRVEADSYYYRDKGRVRKRQFSRLVPPEVWRHGKDALYAWIETTVPGIFHGAGIHIITPLHHDIGVIDPDTQRFKLTS